MKKAKSLAIVFVVLVSVSCEQALYQAPYVLIGPESLVGEGGVFFNYAGIFAELHNTSEKDIASLEISFDVFDRTTKKNPFAGSNHISCSYTDLIYSQETADLCISLDSYIHTMPEEEFVISNFCITSIGYTDGSRWTDYLCMYSVCSN